MAESGEQSEQLNFREWTAHYEKEQEADRSKVDHLADTVGVLIGTVGKLSANVETWIETQKSMSHRMNRPWQWGVVVAGFMAMFSMSAMFATMATLIVNPIQRNIAHLEATHATTEERNLELHMWFKETVTEMQINDAKAETDIKWLEKLQGITNERLHKSMTEKSHP